MNIHVLYTQVKHPTYVHVPHVHVLTHHCSGCLSTVCSASLSLFHSSLSEQNLISVWNGGRGIPVEMHATEKMYVPELIFGTLLTSSNYDDEQKKVTGGRNGYGAKLCNIFSTEFMVETACKESGKTFKQVM